MSNGLCTFITVTTDPALLKDGEKFHVQQEYEPMYTQLSVRYADRKVVHKPSVILNSIVEGKLLLLKMMDYEAKPIRDIDGVGYRHSQYWYEIYLTADDVEEIKSWQHPKVK